MSFISDVSAWFKGEYITVEEIANGFGTTTLDARQRLTELEEQGILREIKPSVYVGAVEDVGVLKDKINQKFSDTQTEDPPELQYLE